MEPFLYIKSFTQASELLQSEAGQKITHVISIGDPKSEQLPQASTDFRQVLRLEFFDVEPPEGELPEDPDFPGRKHMEQIIDFEKAYLAQENRGLILIHCQAGVSRSVASASVLLYLHPDINDEESAMEKLVEMKYDALPNLVMLKYADEILGSKLKTYGKIVSEKRQAVFNKQFEDFLP